MELYYNTLEDNNFSKQLKEKIDLYDISYALDSHSVEEDLCSTYGKAIKFYSKLDPVNGSSFVESIIDCIKDM